MSMSPDGSRLAYLNRVDGVDYLFSFDVATKQAKPLVSVNDLKARGAYFVGNDFIVLITSQSTTLRYFIGRHEVSGAYAYNLKTGKVVQLLANSDDLYPGQTNLGRILGIDPGGKHVYMPAFMRQVSNDDPVMSLMKVNLETGGAETKTKGTETTVDWIVDASGNPIMREDFIEKKKLHEVRTFTRSNPTMIFSEQGDNPEIRVVGASADGKSLIAAANNDSDFLSVYSMDRTDGKLTGPVFERAGAEVDDVVMDSNRVVYGVAYSGMRPTYDMLDDALEKDIAQAQGAFPSAAVRLMDWSDDWSKLLLFVEGGNDTERFVLFDRTAKKLSVVTRGRSQVTQQDIGELITIEYKARDGLKIPALITWPVGVAPDQRKNLPLVVMPHGGPEVYDSIGYDWLAQFIANEGYAVLQPNFRGSGGFGAGFRQAGHGEWGRKMQSDITDGVDAMIKTGWADPNRVCIVGWSYGGYAALAGGALTPDKYKCVVSVAGVSNLREMLTTEDNNHGPTSSTVIFWKELIGDPAKDRDAIDAVSPAKLAGGFKAPVLLIHGTDDLTVPARQSDMMNDALKSAGKPVEYVKINGDDHSLVNNGSRRTALSKIAEFLKTNIGPK